MRILWKHIVKIVIIPAIFFVACEADVDVKPNDTGVFVKFFGGTQTDLGYDAIQTSNGGFACVGSTESFGAGGSDVFFVRTDANGNEITDRITFGDTLDDVGRSIIEKTDGNFLIVGDITDKASGNTDIWMIEITPDGTLVNSSLTQTIGLPGFNEKGHSISATSDGGYVIAGTKTQAGSQDVDSYIVKMDATGLIEWENDDALLNFTDESGSAIIETSSGDFVYSSTSQRDSSAFLTDMRLTSLNNIGQPNWNFFYGTNTRNEIASSIAGGSGNIYSIGSTIDPGTGESDIFLVRTSLGGTALGEFSINFGSEDIGKSVAELRDGNIIIAGESFTSVLNGKDIYLTKINGFGEEIWPQPLIMGGEGDDIASKVFETSDGGIVVFGTISFSGNPMMLLFKTDKNGKLAK
jgi:hypothetical protein